MKANFWLLLTMAFIITACTRSVNPVQPNVQEKDVSESQSLEIAYSKFDPFQIEDMKIDGFDIEDAFQLDSFIIISAYADGDLETSNTPENWGDRLLMVKNDSIHFQSKAVGDPYAYEPNFYHNASNGKVLIICHLGNEESYGAEAFLFENGVVEFIGNIEMECPYETEFNTGLIEILRISEKNNSIYFDFESDSLINLTNNEWTRVKNDGIQYVFEDNHFSLRGL